jgi:hypothetical protein
MLLFWLFFTHQLSIILSFPCLITVSDDSVYLTPEWENIVLTFLFYSFSFPNIILSFSCTRWSGLFHMWFSPAKSFSSTWPVGFLCHIVSGKPGENTCIPAENSSKLNPAKLPHNVIRIVKMWGCKTFDLSPHDMLAAFSRRCKALSLP